MKKGFTLIELLAVIVILAIIAVIAVPIVLNIINDTKESALLRSADFYLEGVETSIATSTLKGITINDGTYDIMQDGNICIGTLDNNICTGDILNVEIDGEVPTSVTIKVVNRQIDDISLNLSNKNIVKNEKGELVIGVTKIEVKLEPGLYNKDDQLLMSWDELVAEYDFKNKCSSSSVQGAAGQVIDSIEGASKLVMDESVTHIASYSFYECANLESIIISNSLISIGECSFYGCINLTSVTMPKGSTNIGEGYIGAGAFNGCSKLTSVTIPKGVTVIHVQAFYGTAITEVTIPSSVTTIVFGAFSYCKNLTTINYAGTEEEWNAIVKESEWDSNTPSNKVINYNYKG